MAAHKLAGTVAKAVRPCQHRQAIEMGFDIIAELTGRAVSAFERFLQRHHADVIEIAGQAFLQALGLGVAHQADGFRCGRCGFGIGLRAALHCCGTGFLRIAAMYDFFNFSRCAGSERVWPLTRKQFVQYDTKRVDISGGGDSLAANLLRRSIFQRHDALTGLGEGRAGLIIADEHFGDTEIEQFHCAVIGDQNIAGL